MAACEITDDYYAILEVSQTATVDIVRKSYLRLAVLLHPDKNPNKPDATTAFQCLSTAYETISDPGKRKVYDLQWVRLKHRQNTEQEARRRQAEAAETERKRAAEERLNRQKEQKASQECLQQLLQLRSSYDSSIFEINRVVRRLTADLKRLRDEDDEEMKKEGERNSWWAYFTSPIYGKVQETAGQKQQRETERLQRQASKRVKESELGQKEARLQGLKSALQDVNSKIVAEKKKTDDEARAQRQEQLRKEQAARRQFQEQQERERLAKWQAELQKAAKEAREAQAAREAREAQAAKEAREAQKAAQEARAAREAAAAAAAARKRFSKPAAATASKKSSSSSHRASTASSSKTCRHEAFWPKLQGSHLCSECHTVQRRFAFQCPGCKMVACASCRQSLRNEKNRNDRKPGPRWGDYYDDPDIWGI